MNGKNNQHDMVVGKSVCRVDALEKVTGKLKYAFDLALPKMLHAKVLRSPYAHAHIRGIDVEGAVALPGVKAVVCGRDFANVRLGGWLRDRPPYAVDQVRYIGEPVAGVAAVDEDTALRALAQIKVQYEELPAVFDPVEATGAGAPLIHPELGLYPRMEKEIHPVSGTNICNHMKIRRGNVEEGFGSSDCVLEETYSVPMAQHCALEPHIVIVDPGTAGKLTVWTSAQGPHIVQALLASAFGIPLNRLRIITPPIGGGFGGKGSLKIEPLCLPLAMKAEQPVRLVMTAEEELSSVITKTAAHIRVCSGVSRGGKLLARRVTIHWDAGGYAEASLLISRNSGYSAIGPYDIPNVRVDSYCVYTNKVPGGGMRGFGMPEVTWAIEQHTDSLAQKLGIDPVELRLMNIVKDGSISATGQTLESVGVGKTLEEAAERIGWRSPQQKDSGERRRGRGIACMHKGTVCPTATTVTIQLKSDGKVALSHGAVEMGQGVYTILTQLVAEEVGIPIDQIEVTRTPDTETSPYDWQTAASRATFWFGNAIHVAAADFRRELLKQASYLLSMPVKDLMMKQGRVYSTSDPSRTISLEQLASGDHSPNGTGNLGPISATGTYVTTDTTPLDPETGYSPKPTVFWMYGTQAAEVEVDMQTGEVRVLKLVACHDAGRVVNPLLAECQIEGALAMGMGMALTEEVVMNDGRVVNDSLVDYKVIRASDSTQMEVSFVELPHPEGLYGIKGIAEAGLCPTAAAIANAIRQAIGAPGPFASAPISPTKVLVALKKGGGLTP